MDHIDVGNGKQIVFWPHPREWTIGYWRWPNARIREEVRKHSSKTFGFHGFCLGPIEFRYWPNPKWQFEQLLGKDVQ